MNDTARTPTATTAEPNGAWFRSILRERMHKTYQEMAAFSDSVPAGPYDPTPVGAYWSVSAVVPCV